MEIISSSSSEEMAAQTIQTITILLIVASTLTFWGLCWIIASYLRQKSNNHQTIVDRFGLDFLIHFMTFNTIINAIICLIRLDYKCGETFAFLIQALSIFQFFTFLTWFIAIIFVKYVTIFHPSLFADSDHTDEEILVKARFYTTGISIILFIIEVGVFQNSTQSFIFRRLSGKEADKEIRSRLGVMHLFVFATVISIIYVNFKIKKSGYQEANSPNWLRKFKFCSLFVCLALISLVLIYATFPVKKIKSPIFQCIVSVVFSWTSTLLPAVFIMTYDNLRLYFVQKCSYFS